VAFAAEPQSIGKREMKRTVILLALVGIVLVSACTPPLYGVRILLREEARLAFSAELERLARQANFVASEPYGRDGFSVSLAMKEASGKLTIHVYRTGSTSEAFIGRRGGLGLRLSAEEKQIIERLVSSLADHAAVVSIERRGYEKTEPIQPPQTTTESGAPGRV
jgi:hypothetical protein